MYVCNGCHELLMMSKNLNDIGILNINGINYRCIIVLYRCITTFGKPEIEKHQDKSRVLIYHVDIDKILVSNKVFQQKRF